MRIVRHIDGMLVMRPAASTKNPTHWQSLQIARREVQRDEHGNVHCATCWTIEDGRFPFDLHHRHYNNFGAEKPEDVVLLCRPCHDAITSRIRDARRAHGDRSLEVMGETAEQTRADFRPAVRSVGIQEGRDLAPSAPAFRPHSSRYQ